MFLHGATLTRRMWDQQVAQLASRYRCIAMARLDHTARSFAKTEPMLGELSLAPSEYIRRQVRFTPYPGEDIGAMITATGPELYLFSSDYPHHEGTRDPIGKFEHPFEQHHTDEPSRQAFYEDNYRHLFAT